MLSFAARVPSGNTPKPPQVPEAVWINPPLAANPVAGLLFIDFESGDLLQVAGRTSLILDGPEVARFEGAQRLWTVTVEHLVRRPAALALRWQFAEFSPFSLGMGSW